MSQFLSWVCPCCLFGPSYARIDSDDAAHSDSSRPRTTTVELVDAVSLTDDEHPIYTIDDEPVARIAPLPLRSANGITRSAPLPASLHYAAVAAMGGQFESEEAESSRPTLPPLTVDSGSSSQITSVSSSPSWVDAADRLLTPLTSSSRTRSLTEASSAVAASTDLERATSDNSAAAGKSSSFSSSLSYFAAAPRSLFSFSSPLSSPLSSAASPPSTSLLPAQLLSTIASAVKQLAYGPTVDESLNGEGEPASGQSANGTMTGHERADRTPDDEAPQQREQHTERAKQRLTREMAKKEEAEEDERAGKLIKGVPSPVIRIPSPRHQQQSKVLTSPTLNGSHVQQTESSLPSVSISPSVAPTSPGVSSASDSPSSALLSSSFSSIASGVSLSSSVPSSSSPRTSPFASSQLLSSSLPTPLQLDSHVDSHVPHPPSSASSGISEEMRVSQSVDTNGVVEQAAHAVPHDTFHRRLSSAVPPVTTAAAAPPASSIRTNPPSPVKGAVSAAPSTPSIPAALPAASAAPIVHFKKGENPLLSLGIPKGSVSVEHISSLLALFTQPPSTSASPASLLSTLASHLTYIHLFNFVISAPRTVSSAVFKHFSQPILAHHKPPHPRPSPNAQIGLLLLQFLTDYLVSISTSASALTFTFDFPRQSDSFTLDVPTPDMFVLESRHPSDPTLVHPLNVVRKADSEVRRIVFNRVVRVMIGRDRGIVGLGSGDLSVKKVFSFSCDMRYERRVGEVDVDGNGRQVVEDRDGKVRVKGGHYVLARYDDWLVVTVLGQQVQIGLPAFTSVNQ